MFNRIQTSQPVHGRVLRAIGFCVITLVMSFTARAGTSTPQFITFDAPGAGTASGQGTGCFAYTDCSVLINAGGTIAGYYLDANNVFHGFIRTPDGQFLSFEAPGADTTAGDFNGTLPNAINDAGAVTGVYFDINNAGHGFLRSPQGVFTTFDVPGGSQYTSAIAINEEGTVAGVSLDYRGIFQGFLRRADGTFARWTGPGACESTSASGCYGTGAFGINAVGTVVGGYEDDSGIFVDHGLIRSAQGGFTSFEAPGAGGGSYQGTGCPGCSVSLNQAGVIASYFIDDSGVVHGFVRASDGLFTTFDAPAAAGLFGFNCYADCSLGLNDRGAITGTFLDANNVDHGFVRSPDGTLTSFDAPGADTTPNSFHGTFPVSINDKGAITGYYLDVNNVAHGFIRLPGQ